MVRIAKADAIEGVVKEPETFHYHDGSSNCVAIRREQCCARIVCRILTCHVWSCRSRSYFSHDNVGFNLRWQAEAQFESAQCTVASRQNGEPSAD